MEVCVSMLKGTNLAIILGTVHHLDPKIKFQKLDLFPPSSVREEGLLPRWGSHKEHPVSINCPAAGPAEQESCLPQNRSSFQDKTQEDGWCPQYIMFTVWHHSHRHSDMQIRWVCGAIYCEVVSSAVHYNESSMHTAQSDCHCGINPHVHIFHNNFFTTFVACASHSSDYEHYYLLGCDTVWSGTSSPTISKTTLSPSSFSGEQ